MTFCIKYIKSCLNLHYRNWKADKSIGLEEYRTLRLLSNFHNFVFAYPAMAILVGGVTLCTSIAFYLLITSAHVVPLPVLILFSIIAFDFFFAVHGVFKIVSYPYTKSLDFFQLVKVGNYTKYELRYIKSCPPSKLSLGNGGFFDRLTSLVIWQKCIDYVIMFLLM